MKKNTQWRTRGSSEARAVPQVEVLRWRIQDSFLSEGIGEEDFPRRYLADFGGSAKGSSIPTKTQVTACCKSAWLHDDVLSAVSRVGSRR